MINLEAFENWLAINFPVEEGRPANTQKMYLQGIKHFIKEYEDKYKKEPEIDQRFINFLIVQSVTKGNSFYKSCATAFGDFACEGHKELALKFPKRRSKVRVEVNSTYDFITKEDVDKIINHTDIYISLIAELMKCTGLRRHEIITQERSGIDFDKLLINGIGKNNKEYRLPITKNIAERLKIWIIQAPNPDLPFMPYKDGVTYKQPDNYLHRRYQKVCKQLDIKTAEDKTPHVHYQRHQFGRGLREKGLDIVEIKSAMRHSKIETTKIYVDLTKEESEKAVRKTFDEEEKDGTSL